MPLHTDTANEDAAVIANEVEANATPVGVSIPSKEKITPMHPKLGRIERGASRPKTAPPATKAHIVLKKLATAKGITVVDLMEATGWQRHSVRGFLSGSVKKKFGLELTSEVGKDGVRCYRTASQSRDR